MEVWCQSKQGSRTRGACGGREKTICAADQKGRADPKSFHFLCRSKKTITMTPYVALDLGSRWRHGLHSVVGLVGRLSRLRNFDPSPISGLQCARSAHHLRFSMQPIVSCTYRVAHGVSTFDGATLMHRTPPSFLLSRSCLRRIP